MRVHRIRVRFACCAIAAAMLAGCQVDSHRAAVADGSGFSSTALESVVGPSCAPGEGGDPRAVRLGMAPCDLVHTLGRPKDVVVSQLPDGGKRVSMFYRGTGGTTRSYTFIGDKLISTPPGELKARYAGRQ